MSGYIRIVCSRPPSDGEDPLIDEVTSTSVAVLMCSDLLESFG